MAILLLAPFTPSALIGALGMDECTWISTVIPCSSGLMLLHQLFARHNRNLSRWAPDVDPLIWQLAAFAVVGALFAAWLIAKTTIEGISDLFLSVFSISLNLGLSAVYASIPQANEATQRTVWPEVGLFFCMLWTICVGQLPPFRLHHAWVESGLAAIVLFSQVLYLCDLFGDKDEHGGASAGPVER